MEKIYSGWLNSGYYDGFCLSDNENYRCFSTNIIKEFISIADSYGHNYKNKKTSLGGNKAFIPNINMRMYFCEEKCTLEEAMEKFDKILYGDDFVEIETSYVGYSEWTILGMNVDNFSIGGHDLIKEFSSHIGEYVHIIVEVED